jgi:hypothetical protein
MSIVVVTWQLQWKVVMVVVGVVMTWQQKVVVVVVVGVFHVLDVVTWRHEGGGDGADAAPYKSLRKKKLVQ